jgi:hypothetical protein
VQPVRAVRPEVRSLADVGGINIHAEVAIDGRDRKRLEHVLRYMARPPHALDCGSRPHADANIAGMRTLRSPLRGPAYRRPAGT